MASGSSKGGGGGKKRKSTAAKRRKSLFPKRATRNREQRMLRGFQQFGF